MKSLRGQMLLSSKMRCRHASLPLNVLPLILLLNTISINRFETFTMKETSHKTALLFDYITGLVTGVSMGKTQLNCIIYIYIISVHFNYLSVDCNLSPIRSTCLIKEF